MMNCCIRSEKYCLSWDFVFKLAWGVEMMEGRLGVLYFGSLFMSMESTVQMKYFGRKFLFMSMECRVQMKYFGRKSD